MKFEPLASSSAGNAYRVSGGGASAPLLLDCGIPFKQLQIAMGFQVTGLAGCLITHAHGDHCAAWKDVSKSAVDIYASAETWTALGEKDASVNGDSFQLHVGSRAKVVNPEEGFWVGDWRVLPFPVVHDCPGTLGFLIGSPNDERLLYLTDSMYSPFRFDGLTMIAIECNHSETILRENAGSGRINRDRYNRTARTHMSLERCIGMLKANDLSKCKHIYLLHLSSENSNEAEFKKAVEEATGIPTTVCAERTKVSA